MSILYGRSRIRRLSSVLFLGSLTLCLWLGHPVVSGLFTIGTTVIAQTPNAEQQVQQGVERYEAGEYRAAITVWQAALTEYQKVNDSAKVTIVQENLARAYQQLGQSEQAVIYWQQAIAYYRQNQNLQQVGRLLTEQAQAYSNLGQSRKAIALLCQVDQAKVCAAGTAVQIAQLTDDQLGEAAALGSLGDAYRLRGDYNQAIQHLQSSRTIAQSIENIPYQVSTLNSLGNVYVSLAQVNYRRANSAKQQGDDKEAQGYQQKGVEFDQKALEAFQQGLSLVRQLNDAQGQLQLLINTIPVYYRIQNTSLAKQVWQQASTLLNQLPDSRIKIYAAIDLASLLQPVQLFDETSSKTRCLAPTLSTNAASLLQEAASTAQRLADSRAASFVRGELGHLYECQGNYQQALELTQQARWYADQDLRARDSLYLWEWQAARILKAQGERLEAIAAYDRAVAILEAIRNDIVTADRDLKFDFRDTIEPIYRELVALRLELETAQPLSKSNPKNTTQLAQNAATSQPSSQDNIKSILKTVDSLKVAELQNFFGNDCVVIPVGETPVDSVGASTATATFSTIILPDKMAILVALPDGQRRLNIVDIDRETLRQRINDFRRELEKYYDNYDVKLSQQVYDWFIRPFEQELAQAQVKTLVFVQDGILRSVPMAALHDGQQFLIQKYAIATTPSLTLTNTQAINREQLRALLVGLTKGTTINGRQFSDLPNVNLEVSGIKNQLPGSIQLLDEEFSRTRLQQALSESTYPIIHIATHGEFGTEPANTFLVTGNGEKLTLTELDEMIRSTAKSNTQIELLALTACQTAVGNDRSALGLAGVAVQAGAKSALASLWFINDATTAELAKQFYTGLQDPGLNKAEALRAAQVSILQEGGEQAHPYYWASLILIGNWL